MGKEPQYVTLRQMNNVELFAMVEKLIDAIDRLTIATMYTGFINIGGISKTTQKNLEFIEESLINSLKDNKYFHA